MDREPIGYAPPPLQQRRGPDFGLIAMGVFFAAPLIAAVGWSVDSRLLLMPLVVVNPLTGVACAVVGLVTNRGGDTGAAGPALALNGFLLVPFLVWVAVAGLA